MRVNVYKDDIPKCVEIVDRGTPEGDFQGLRFTTQHGDAITFWDARGMRSILQAALKIIDEDAWEPCKPKRKKR